MDGNSKRIFFLISALFLGLAMLASVPLALAQSGCTGDPCIFETPTTTPTMTPTATPDVGAGTPTVAPWPTSEAFPNPNYGIPTSIPDISLPGTPTAILSIDLPDTPEPIIWATLDLPDPITSPYTGTNTITYSLALTLDMEGSGAVTGTGIEMVTGIISDGNGWLSDTISYTNYISGLVATIEGTNTFTIATAPDWYAPALPRDIANVGWTFELQSTSAQEGTTYSLATWVYMFGQTVSMPFRLAKGIWIFFQSLGPFGLLVIWIFVMFPLVFGLRMLPYARQVFWNIVQFFERILYWIQELWDAIPFKMS